MTDSLSSKRYSIGSSSVMMCFFAVTLMCSIIAASVVDLPEPVAPVISTMPRGASAMRRHDRREVQFLERAHPRLDQRAGP